MSTRASQATAVHLDTGTGPRCGHRYARQLTADRGAVTCRDCLDITAGTYGRGRRWHWADVQPHGTRAAYRRHLRHGTRPCESCLQAERRAWADKYSRSAA